MLSFPKRWGSGSEPPTGSCKRSTPGAGWPTYLTFSICLYTLASLQAATQTSRWRHSADPVGLSVTEVYHLYTALKAKQKLEMGFFLWTTNPSLAKVAFVSNQCAHTSRLLLPAAQRGAGDAPRLRFVSSFILQVGRQAEWNKQEAALCFSSGAFFITAAVSSTAAVLSISPATPEGEECSDGGWKVQFAYLLTWQLQPHSTWPELLLRGRGDRHRRQHLRDHR